MGAAVSEQDLLLVSQRLRKLAGFIHGDGGIPELRQAAEDALTAASNSCDARYLRELLFGLVEACEALANYRRRYSRKWRTPRSASIFLLMYTIRAGFSHPALRAATSRHRGVWGGVATVRLSDGRAPGARLSD
jgi:hypothetical protein